MPPTSPLCTSLRTFIHALCRRSAQLDSAQLANCGAAVVDIQRLQPHCAGQTMVQVATAAACHKQKLQAHNAEAAEAATIVVPQNKHTHTHTQPHPQSNSAACSRILFQLSAKCSLHNGKGAGEGGRYEWGREGERKRE